MTHADGWAVVGERGLDIRTVSESRREAIINWLIKARVVAFDASNYHTDEEIEYLWIHHGVNTGRATVTPVDVKVSSK